MPYYVYVIKLNKKITRELRFIEKNPSIDVRKSCYYVGQSSLVPDLRFDQHKYGYKSCKFVKKYGFSLVEEHYEKYNPIPTRKEAEKMEQYLAEKLRAKGYGVWMN